MSNLMKSKNEYIPPGILPEGPSVCYRPTKFVMGLLLSRRTWQDDQKKEWGTQMKILLFGAGAVGLVYGRHLQMAGCEVSFYVREKYAEEARQGYTLYHWNKKKALENPIRFSGFGVLTTLEEVKATEWDQVYLCVSATAIRAGWLEDFIGAIGDKSILVSLQPGTEDREYILQYLKDESRLVNGMISFSSYHCPMEGENPPEHGMAYWCPPMSPCTFSSSNKAAAKAVVAPLKKGKLPSKVAKDVVAFSVYPSAFLMHLVAVMEANDWSFRQTAKTGGLDLIARATREAFPILKKKFRPPVPLWLMSLPMRAFVLKTIIKLVPWVVPFNFETFLKVHFTKVGDQTEMLIGDYMEKGEKYSLATPTIAQIHTKLQELRK